MVAEQSDLYNFPQTVRVTQAVFQLTARIMQDPGHFYTLYSHKGVVYKYDGIGRSMATLHNGSLYGALKATQMVFYVRQ